MSAVEFLPGIEGRAYCGCGCGYRTMHLDLSASPHPGFGAVRLERDGTTVYPWPDDDHHAEMDRVGMEYEAVAAGDPDHDWRLHVDGPLSDYTYQRQGDGLGVLVRQGMGFA